VQSGEPAGAATIYGYKAAKMKADTPGQVDFLNYAPLPSSLNLTDIVAHAPHPAAARLFDDWLVSQEGQQAIVDLTNHTSVREDVKNDATVWNEAKWSPAWGKPMLDSGDYNSELAEYQKALHAPQ
jgi:ABC-type Fe3+ transport system substrate-binding protein